MSAEMEEWHRVKADLVRNMVKNRIERRRRLYTRTKNPMHALEAYRMARIVKIEVPSWILELFDHWAGALCVNPPKGAKAIADALGLGTKGGPSITIQAKNQARDLEIAERVLLLHDQYPDRDKLDIFGQVAEEFSLSSDRLAGIWYDLMRGVKY